jgi:hypothetical protein
MFMELHASLRRHFYSRPGRSRQGYTTFSQPCGRRSRDVIDETGKLKSLRQFIYGDTGAIFIGATAAKLSETRYAEALV